MEKEMQSIKFNKQKFDALVCLNGDLPRAKEIDKFGAIPFYAADGAASKLFQLGFMPDFIVGDIDSLEDSPIMDVFSKEKIMKIPGQGANDFEKVLDFAIDRGDKNIVVIGIHGGELEHTLNNWSVLKKYSEKLNLCIFDAGRYGIPLLTSTKIQLEIGELVSLIPQPKCKLSSTNLKWELDNEVLEFGVREGARNETTSDEINLDIKEGSFLFFCNSRVPVAPEY